MGFSQNSASASIDIYYNEEDIYNNERITTLGGALYGDSILLKSNHKICFSDNMVNLSSLSSGSYMVAYSETPKAAGGAIYGAYETIVSGNKEVTFSFNSAYANAAPSYALGGAIYAEKICIDNNRKCTFEYNYAGTAGGAVFAHALSIVGNETVLFKNNCTLYDGGAIYSTGAISICNNDEIRFIDNEASDGGAICSRQGEDIVISDNGLVVFSGNTTGNIGAISTYGPLYIQNNDSALFEKNLQSRPDDFRLLSVQAFSLTLSAAAGRSIVFHDSIMVTGNMNLNSSYITHDELTLNQSGDIVFSGAYTEQHLNELLTKKQEKRVARASEILASRTSEIYAMTNLHGGRLRVEDGAIYQGYGITAHDDSASTVRVKDAELSHVGYELEFNAGTTLEVAGESTIRGQVNLKEGSVFKLELGAVLCLHETAGADAATLYVSGTAFLSGDSTLNADLTLADGATLDMENLDAGAVTLNGALTFGEQVTIGENLLALLEDIKTQTEGVALFTGIDSLTLPQTATTTTSNRVWAGVVFSNLASSQNYYLVYQADTGTLSIVYNVPEPATATLSLLALAALAKESLWKSLENI